MLCETLKNKIETLEIEKNVIEEEKAKTNKQIAELEKQAAELDVALLPINAKIKVYHEVIDELAVIKAETECTNGEKNTPSNYTFETGV